LKSRQKLVSTAWFRLKLALAEMYVQGVSTRKVSAIVEQLCGHSVSSTQVSQCAAKLDTELESWHQRPIESCRYVFLDARYEKVRQGGQVLDCAVLIALGVRADGKRSILGVSVALSEAEVHWRNLPGQLATTRSATTNPLERVNMELKRRTRVASVFPNETSLLRLVSALLAETSDEWETGKVYLNMECLTQPSV
jgi:transposase-like protein